MTANEALSAHIAAVSAEDPTKARALVREIKHNCDVSNYVYSNWLRGVTPIKRIYRREIIEIIGHDIFENVAN